MLYCRFHAGDAMGYGVVEQHEVCEITPDPFSAWEKTGRAWALGEVKLLAPVQPGKIVAVGLNYRDHIAEFGRTTVPEEPVLFMKPPSAVIGPNDAIRLPPGAGRVDYEAELALVIKSTVRAVPESEALSHVLGATALNDVSARELQKKDKQWIRAKGFDTFCPIGPWIAEGLPYDNLRVETYQNGKPVQQGHTRDMIFPAAKLVSFISSVMTLYPGDVIATGTPMGVGPIQPGDVIEVFVEGVGKLRNEVASAAP